MKKSRFFIFFMLFCMLLPSTSLAKKVRKKKKGYSAKVNSRPLVLPKGMNEINSGLSYTSFDFGGKSLSSTALGVGFKRGIIKGLEVGGSTGLLLNPEFDWSSGLGLKAGYRLNGKKRGLALAAQLEIPLYFGEGVDLLSGITAGVATRYRIHKMFALHTGEGLLTLGFGDETTVRLNVPIGVAAQFSKQFNLRLDTRLISFGSGGALTPADTLPINIRAIYAINRMMDVGAGLNTDLASDAGSTVVMGLFNYRIR